MLFVQYSTRDNIIGQAVSKVFNESDVKLSHNPCSEKIGYNHNMKGGKSLPCRNRQTYVQETKDKARQTPGRGQQLPCKVDIQPAPRR